MSPWEFWTEFDHRIERERKRQMVEVGGGRVSAALVQEAQKKARALHKAKKQKAKEKAA